MIFNEFMVFYVDFIDLPSNFINGEGLLTQGGGY